MKRSFKVILSISLIIAFIATSLGLTRIPVSSIKLNTTQVYIQAGKTYTLKVTVTPANATNKNLVFSSGNKNIATVDKNGKIKGITYGKTVIAIKSASNKKAVAKCNVIIFKIDNKKHFNISYIFGDATKIPQDNWVAKKLNKLFNITLSHPQINANNSEQWNLLLSSGDIPDYGMIGSKKAYDDGITRTIPKAMIMMYAPNYANILDNLAWKKFAKNENELYGIPGFQGYNVMFTWIPVIRLDWLENLKISPKGSVLKQGSEGLYYTSTAYTRNELEDILKRFTFNDPDRNGKKDTYGMMIEPTNIGYSTYFIQSTFNELSVDNNDLFPTERNGKATDMMITEEYKQFLKYMKHLWDIGVIDPESKTNTWPLYHERMNLGQAGVGTVDAFYCMADRFLDRFPQGAVAKTKGAKALITAPAIGPNGEQGTRIPQESLWRNNGFGVSKKVDDEKLARILQLIDFLVFDKEGRVLATYGEEGVHFKWEGEPYNSRSVYKEGYKEATQLASVGLNFYSTYQTQSLKEAVNSFPVKNRNFYELMIGEWRDKFVRHRSRGDYFNETKFTDYNVKYFSNISTIFTEYFWNAITGKVNIDSSWDKYLKDMDDNGLGKIIEEYNKMPLTKDIIDLSIYK